MKIVPIWIKWMSGIYGWYLFHNQKQDSFSTNQFRILQFQTNAQTQYFDMHLPA